RRPDANRFAGGSKQHAELERSNRGRRPPEREAAERKSKEYAIPGEQLHHDWCAAAWRPVAGTLPTKSSRTARYRGEPPIDGVESFVDVDIQQAHVGDPASPQMMTSTDLGARNGDVRGGPRSVARRPRRTVNRDDRRADGRRDVRRPGVAGHHQRSAAR